METESNSQAESSQAELEDGEIEDDGQFLQEIEENIRKKTAKMCIFSYIFCQVKHRVPFIL